MAQREETEKDATATEGPVEFSNPSLDEEGLRFPEHWIILAKRKKFILRFFLTCTLLATLTVFLLPKRYIARTQIMPPNQNQSMSAMAALSQLGSLATLVGKDALRAPGDIYIAMLRSRTIADSLIDRFALTKVYREKLRMEAERDLENRTEITTGKGGVILISVEDRDPKRAADLANGYADELDKLTRVLAVSEAGQRRVFFEREMRAANDELADAEVALKQTQEKTGLIILDSQSRAMIESVSSVRARVAAQEVAVQSMRSFATSQNPDLLRAEQELAALKSQLDRLESGQGQRAFAEVPLEKVPAAGLEYVRKLREVKYREALFELLSKQYEAARIDEARDALIVQVLDRAVPPERHSWPKRSILVLVSMLVAFLSAVVVASFMEKLRKAKDDPHFASRFQLFWFYLRGQ